MRKTEINLGIDDQQRREQNIELFKKAIYHLGRQEFDLCVSHLSEDVVCEWPYVPRPDLPDTLVGRNNVRAMFQQMEDLEYDPYNYQFDDIHELLDPNTLIAEYHAESRHRPSGKPYANRYISILKFNADRKISLWREYLNPLPVYDTLDIEI
jgi:ketosteroid isomerase-like protein